MGLLAPVGRAAWEDDRRLRNRSWATIGMGFGALIMAFVLRSLFPLMWVLVGVVLLFTGLTMWAVSSSRQIGISLDGSRRWVTFSRVHPEFVRAVEARESAATPAGR